MPPLISRCRQRRSWPKPPNADGLWLPAATCPTGALTAMDLQKGYVPWNRVKRTQRDYTLACWRWWKERRATYKQAAALTGDQAAGRFWSHCGIGRLAGVPGTDSLQPPIDKRTLGSPPDRQTGGAPQAQLAQGAEKAKLFVPSSTCCAILGASKSLKVPQTRHRG